MISRMSAKIKNGFTPIKSGFTLIELLVVISLIGILSTLILANLNSARERSRDVQRKSDLRSVQTALRLYYNDVGSFPASNSSYAILGCGSGGTSACSWGSAWTKGTTTYMNILPTDPLSSQSYRYARIDSDTYTIEACLENKSDNKAVDTTNLTWCPSGKEYKVQP